MKQEQGTGYHAVNWREPIIYQLGQRGRRGYRVPSVEDEMSAVVGDVISGIPEEMRRKKAPNLPELSEPEIVRHYIRLSQQTYGVDSGIHMHGTCTMKYSPKVDEAIVRSPKLAELHPLQDFGTVQGILRIMHEFGECLCEISGMAQFSLQPRGGAHAVFSNALCHQSLSSIE